MDAASEGRTIFFSTHILSDVEAVADTVGIVKDGRLVVGGEIDCLRASHKVFRLPPKSRRTKSCVCSATCPTFWMSRKKVVA